MRRNTKAILFYAAMAAALIGVHVVAIMMVKEGNGVRAQQQLRPTKLQLLNK